MLESANADLESKVAARTQDLLDANAHLKHEVREREQAEQSLRDAQAELVHAAKMAMMGQLAAGITHELTQPLGAIRTLSGNAEEFMRRGQLDPVPMLLTQLGSHTRYGAVTSPIPQLQLAASLRNPRKIVMVGPKYVFDYVDGVHLSSQSYRHLGEYYGKVYTRLILQGTSWEPLRPLVEQLYLAGNGAVVGKFLRGIELHELRRDAHQLREAL